MNDVIKFKHKQVAFRMRGDGPVVVLLHGFMESLTIWDNYYNELCKTNFVIAIDLPGHGKTENFEEVHTMAFMAQVVKEVLDSLHIKECVIVAHSMGGYVALAFANEYKEMIKGLVLFHSHALDDTEVAKQNRLRSIDLIKHDKGGFIASFVPSLFDKANVETYSNTIAQLIETSKKMMKEGIIAAQLGMKDRGSAEAIMQQLTIPVLSVFGKQDTRMPYEKLMEQAALPKHAELLVLDNCGHMGFIEQFDKTLHVISAFVNRCF